MQCLLMRHGIAVEPQEWQGPESDRPLTERGAKRVAQVASGLRRLDIEPTHILSSPLIRAAATAKIVQAMLKTRASIRLIDELLPDASPELLLTLLQRLPPECCVLCVGHEPHLSQTASVLLTGKPSPAFPFKKAGVCSLEVTVPIKPGKAVLRWWMGPGSLRALGGKKGRG
ncbi:MAG TPA: phosphohistidine phosphatase SixA [Nitrospira sp.]|nr:phosphohistidine phosphatase SixA [Nitrospira sp.]